MKKKAMRKDFYMEIKKSPGRFLSILFIVALGVAFFSGIRASEPDMRKTGDSYFDAAGLMDIKAFSTYGVTEKDVEAFGKLETIEQAEGAYSADFLHEVKNDQRVLHVIGLQKEMNRITVSEGRLPTEKGECLADDSSDYQIGDKIVLTSGTEDPVSDTLAVGTLEVVGRGNSPCYLSLGRGSTTIGTGNIYAYLAVPEEIFDQEVYSEVYLRVKGADEQIAFTKEYEEIVEDAFSQVEDITSVRGIIRKQEVIDEANEKLAEAEQDLKKGKKKAKKKLKKAGKELKKAEKQLKDAKKELADGKAKISDAKETLKRQQKKLNKSAQQYRDGKKAWKKGRKKYKKQRKKFDKNRPEAEKQLKDGKNQLKKLGKQIERDEETFRDVQRQIEKLEEIIKSGGADDLQAVRQQLSELRMQEGGLQQKLSAQKKAYSGAEQKLSLAQKQLASGEKQLDQAEETIKMQKKKLDDAKKQIDSGQKQIDAGWEELKTQEKKLNDGEKEIKENEGKLDDAKKEYKKAKRKAKKEIADGEAEIEEAKQDIADIEDPEWYVYDRNTLVEYTGFGENAERLGAIGKVFPVLFFLVAALISLTSITRMVEEQRTSIGTMKALGYNKFSIALKYLGYALLATLGGSILGVLIGEKILPLIIIYAYGILYPHLPEILIPYEWGYGFMASGIAIFCTLAATFFSCYRELKGQPSVLMRPPAPKNGRRVFMERIPIVWKHLNFTWKSTIRNLMRYKKRFFMTIFGIAGCMALMLVGFGLKDSCYEIAELQYQEIQFYDASVYLEKEISPEQKQEVHQALKQNDETESYTDVNMQSLTLVSGKKEREVYECVFRSAEDISRFVSFHDRKSGEAYTLSDEGVIINEKTAKLLDVESGDIIYIKDEENGSKPIVVTAVCENYLGHYMYMTPAYYEKLYGEVPEYNSIFFTVRESCDKEGLQSLGKNLLKKDGVINVSYIGDTEKQLDDMLRSLNLVIVVLIISAGMLAFVVLYNLNTVNIAERKRELATLKVLGFYPLEVAEYVYRENILLTFLGAAAGCGLGNLLHRFIIETVEVDSVMFGRIINSSSYMYSLLLTVLFSLLINGLMYFKLKKIDMVESLKSIE